jgi:hypothetical protein
VYLPRDAMFTVYWSYVPALLQFSLSVNDEILKWSIWLGNKCVFSKRAGLQCIRFVMPCLQCIGDMCQLSFSFPQREWWNIKMINMVGMHVCGRDRKPLPCTVKKYNFNLFFYFRSKNYLLDHPGLRVRNGSNLQFQFFTVLNFQYIFVKSAMHHVDVQL